MGQGYAYCQTIDYSVLKKGIVSNGSSGEKTGTSVLRVLAIVVFAGVVGSMV